MDTTYWNSNGRYQIVQDLLAAKIPVEGPVQNTRKNRALEKFRRASNCYYDLYNNGLCNRMAEFTYIFDLSARAYRLYGKHGFDQLLYRRTEEKMDAIVYAAAVEQGLALCLETTV